MAADLTSSSGIRPCYQVRMYRLLVIAALLGSACKGKDRPAGTAGASAPACAKATAHGPLSWIEDDYPAALACAKARNVPLVVDLWAPWCHTCLSMQTTVFMDPSFKAAANQFVFATIDTDREVNAPVVAKLPLAAWPTFYVVAADETVLARYAGGASVVQFQAFLDAGTKALVGATGADQHLLAAERAFAKKDFETADRELTAALAAAPATWVRRPDALVSLLQTKTNDTAGCLALANESIDQTGTSASATDFVVIALGCADTMAKTDTGAAAVFREEAILRLQELVADPAAKLSIDDRSDAMLTLREALEVVGRKPEAITLAEKQRVMLDEAAAKAPTPKAAMTYNWHLAEVHVFLGRPLEVVPALEKSARELPNEYDPPARLGWVLLKGGKLAEAAAWTDKAIKLAYGPRKARVLSQRADIAAKLGDATAERAYREQVVALWASLPPGQANPDALARAKETLAKLDAPAAGSGSAAGSAGSAGSASAAGSAASAGSAGSGSAGSRTR